MSDVTIEVVEAPVVNIDLAGPDTVLASAARVASEAAAALAEQWANDDEDVIVADGEYSAKHYAAQSAAAAGILPDLYNVPWLDRAMLARTGTTITDWAYSGQYRVMVATAIKAIQIDDGDPDEQYQIRTFANDDGTVLDQIAISRISDNGTLVNSGSTEVTKNADGVTLVTLNGSFGEVVRLWIDYREITETGILVNATDSPLRIMKTSGPGVLQDQIDTAQALATTANGTANLASASAAAEYGVCILGDPIAEGAYPAAMKAKVAGAVTGFYADILSGSGTVTVEVYVGGEIVGTFEVSGETDEALTATVTADDVVWFLLTNTDGITGLWAQVTGASA
jgi:hypothetical protein